MTKRPKRDLTQTADAEFVAAVEKILSDPMETRRVMDYARVDGNKLLSLKDRTVMTLNLFGVPQAALELKRDGFDDDHAANIIRACRGIPLPEPVEPQREPGSGGISEAVRIDLVADGIASGIEDARRVLPGNVNAAPAERGKA